MKTLYERLVEKCSALPFEGERWRRRPSGMPSFGYGEDEGGRPVFESTVRPYGEGTEGFTAQGDPIPERLLPGGRGLDAGSDRHFLGNRRLLERLELTQAAKNLADLDVANRYGQSSTESYGYTEDPGMSLPTTEQSIRSKLKLR